MAESPTYVVVNPASTQPMTNGPDPQIGQDEPTQDQQERSFHRVRQLGSGGCGTVLEVQVRGIEIGNGVSQNPQGQTFALKLELQQGNKTLGFLEGCSALWNEWKIYHHVRKVAQTPVDKTCVPRVYEAGNLILKGHKHHYILIELLGSNLGAREGAMAPVEFREVAPELLQMLEFLHTQCKLIHRDIKPANFCKRKRSGQESNFCIIDFGFCGPTPREAQVDDNERYVGTPDYSSKAALAGCRQGPRDDLESLAFTYLELLLGDRLPWSITNSISSEPNGSGWSSKQIEQMHSVRENAYTIHCQAGLIPRFLETWVDYCRSLENYQVPDYSYLRQLLKECDDTELEAPAQMQRLNKAAQLAAEIAAVEEQEVYEQYGHGDVHDIMPPSAKRARLHSWPEVRATEDDGQAGDKHALQELGCVCGAMGKEEGGGGNNAVAGGMGVIVGGLVVGVGAKVGKSGAAGVKIVAGSPGKMGGQKMPEDREE